MGDFILHLTDIHLTAFGKEERDGDFKSLAVPEPDQSTKLAGLERTLAAIPKYLQSQKGKLAAVIVSGDITERGDAAGMERFKGFLGKLGTALPNWEKVIVVPGNHDIAKGSLPSSPARYDLFHEHIRKLHCVTPPIEGLDSPIEDPDRATPLDGHYLVDMERKWLILPVNSANYSQVTESTKPIADELWRRLPELVAAASGGEKGAGRLSRDEIERVLSGVTAHDPIPSDLWKRIPDLIAAAAAVTPVVTKEQVEAVLDRLTTQDMARVSDRHFEELKAILEAADDRIRREGGDPSEFLRIAVLHHQLLPVSTTEELKGFETSTRLGALRDFFRGHKFDLVLHGHKHAGFQYWDTVTPHRPNEEPHKYFVMSGPSVQWSSANAEICRLIEVDGARARRLTLHKLPTCKVGLQLTSVGREVVQLWDRQEAAKAPEWGTRTLIGANADVVHEQLRFLFESHGKPFLRNVVCQILDPSSAQQIPKSYPQVDVEPGRERWFNEIRDWWQRKIPGLRNDPLNFNHGTRIRAFGAKEIDQFENCIAALKTKHTTSRATIVLVNPETDTDPRKYPSFSMVQITVRGEPSTGLEVDILGFFRKQEMLYWWPVNVAELALLQDEARKRLLPDFSSVSLGKITTVTTLATTDRILPRVAIPKIDRLVDEDAGKLTLLSIWTVFPKIESGMDALAEWQKLLRDLEPQDLNNDGVPIAIRGLEHVLATATGLASKVETGMSAKRFCDVVKELLKANRDYADRWEELGSATPQDHANWSESVKTHLSELLRLVSLIAGSMTA